MFNILKPKNDSVADRSGSDWDSPKSNKDKWNKLRGAARVVALGAAGLTLVGCATGGGNEAPKEQPAATATQEATPPAESAPSPSAETHESKPGATPDVDSDSIERSDMDPTARKVLEEVPAKVGHMFEDDRNEIVENEYGSDYSYEAISPETPDGFNCTGKIQVSERAGVRVDLTCRKDSEDKDGKQLYTLNSGYVPTTLDAEKKLEQKLTHQEILVMIENGELESTGVTVSNFYPNVRTVTVSKDGDINYMYADEAKHTVHGSEEEGKKAAKGIMSSIDRQISKTTPGAEPESEPSHETQQEAADDHEFASLPEVQQVRSAQLGATQVLFKKYGPEQLAGGKSYEGVAVGGGCVSRIEVGPGEEGRTEVFTSARCDDGVIREITSRYYSSNPKVMQVLAQPMSPKELILQIKDGKLVHEETTFITHDTKNDAVYEYTDSRETGLTYVYDSNVPGVGRATEKGEEVGLFGIADNAAGLENLAKAV